MPAHRLHPWQRKRYIEAVAAGRKVTPDPRRGLPDRKKQNTP